MTRCDTYVDIESSDGNFQCELEKGHFGPHRIKGHSFSFDNNGTITPEKEVEVQWE